MVDATGTSRRQGMIPSEARAPLGQKNIAKRPRRRLTRWDDKGRETLAEMCEDFVVDQRRIAHARRITRDCYVNFITGLNESG